MDPVSMTLYEWRVRKSGEQGWRLLAWRMTREEARLWGERHHYEVERVPRPLEVPRSVER
jgi:hypothetical protein